MSDLISRQDAIRWVKTECNPYGKPTLEFESGKKVIEHLEKMPSADRPTGEWVDIDNYYRMATCSNCHKVTMFEKWGEYTRSYNYCPNCGADMREPKLQYGDTDTLQGGLMSAT